MTLYHDFNQSLDREGGDGYRLILEKKIQSSGHRCKIEDFRSRKKPHLDYRIDVDGNIIWCEQKVDKYGDTGNIVVELLAWVKEGDLPIVVPDNVKTRKISPKSDDHDKLCDAIYLKWPDKQKGIGIAGCLPARHVFYYILLNRQHKIHRYYVFATRDIQDYVFASFKKYEFIVTRSYKNNRTWLTLSVLIPSKILEKEITHIKEVF